MKKKLISLFIITCLFGFIGINNSKASDFDDGQSFTTYQTGAMGGLTYNNGVTEYSTKVYSATGASGTVYEAFCMDPAGQAVATNLTATPVKNAQFAAALEAILGSNGSYVAKRTALSAFIYGVARFAGIDSDIAQINSFYNWQSKNGGINYASVFVNTGIAWACQNESVTSKLVNYSGSCQSALTNMATQQYSYYNANSGVFSGSATSEAYSLFVNALNAAANGGNNSSDGTGMTVNGSLNNPQVNDDSVIISAVFSLENMNANGYLNNINFDCPTCSDYGLELSTIEYSVNSGEWQTIENGSETNLAETLLTDLGDGETVNGTINLRITLNKTQDLSADNCSGIPFTITYDYSGVSNFQLAILTGTTGKAPRQNYLVYMTVGDEEETGPNTGSLDGEIPCEKEVCETQITTPICSDNEEEATSDIYAPTEIKKCILDNVDDAGNSYQLSIGNGGVDNKYCQVFCKEDYKDVLEGGDFAHGIILQPAIEDVVCGGYFKLESHIEGQKDCYTGGNTTSADTNGEGSIDKDLYIETIKGIQSDMVDAMNDYNEAEAILEGISAASPQTTTMTCGGTNVELFSINVSWNNYTIYEFAWSDANESGSVSDSTGGAGSRSFSDSITCNPVYDDEGNQIGEELSGEPTAEKNYNDWVTEVQNQKTQAQSNLTTLMNNYKQEINNYNSCLTAWTMDYKFAQKLKFYYDETQGKLNNFNSEIPYYSLIEDSGEEYLEAVEDSYKEESEVVVCMETATEEYECVGDSVTLPLTVDQLASSNVDDYGYDSNYGSAFESKNYVVCDTSGCKTESRQISQASFVRKSIRKGQDYITPTVFYQIEANGKITTNSGYAGDDVKLQALENALPVSTKSVIGGTFRLMLEDLGEFYNESSALGRLIDFDGENEDRSVANALNYNAEDGFDGDFACYYQNNCKPDDCPSCEFEGPNLDICPNCDFDACINCIFNLDELQINVKPITTTEVISVDRDYGYNWVVNTEIGQLTLLSDKAEQTVEEIEENNEMIYNSTKVTDDSGLAFSIRMDSAVTSFIKEYNASAEGKGGYGNDSLTCYDALVDGEVVPNLYCYSELIDDLIENYSDSIPDDLLDIRVSESNRTDDNNSANSGSTNGYWKLWPNWYQTVSAGADGQIYNDNGSFYVIGGPAWK